MELERVVVVEGRTSLRIFLLVVGRLTRFSVSDDEDLSNKKDVSKGFQIHTCIFPKKNSSNQIFVKDFFVNFTRFLICNVIYAKNSRTKNS